MYLGTLEYPIRNMRSKFTAVDLPYAACENNAYAVQCRPYTPVLNFSTKFRSTTALRGTSAGQLCVHTAVVLNLVHVLNFKSTYSCLCTAVAICM